MRRLFAWAALIALTLGLLVPSLAIAQTGTPEPAATGSFGVPMGTAVPFIGSDGAEVGSITVNTVTDPFEGFDSYSAPPRGYHYALVEVTITNTSNRPFEVSPGSFVAVDTDGFVAEQSYVTYTDPSITDLDYLDALAPGDSASGVVPYSLFGDATIEEIYYSPSYDRLVTVLDLRAAPVTAGTTVPVMNNSGAEIAQVTVNSVVAPFEGYDANSAPSRGSTYVAVDVTVTNTGTGVLSVSPSDFQVVDDEGFVLSSSYVSRTDTTVPDYDYVDLAQGESQQGLIVYQIYEGVPVAKVLYGDGYTTLTVVADVQSWTGSGLEAGAQPAVTETSVATVPTTEAAMPTAATVSSADCAGLVEWGLDLSERVGTAAGLVTPFQLADVSTLDAATVRDVGAQLRALGDEQAASNPPVAAVELNTIMTEQFYYALADAVDQIAGALEQNNAAAALAGQMAAMKVVDVFAEDGPYYTAVGALATACPAEMQQLDMDSDS